MASTGHAILSNETARFRVPHLGRLYKFLGFRSLHLRMKRLPVNFVIGRGAQRLPRPLQSRVWRSSVASHLQRVSLVLTPKRSVSAPASIRLGSTA